MAREYWGIDVSPSSLKAVRMEASPEAPRITGFDNLDFDLDESTDEDEISPNIRNGLTTFADRNDLSGTNVTVSLPSHTSFNRFISLPPVEEDRAEEIIEYEAKQHIPFPLEQVIWDYQTVDRDYDPGEEHDVVLFAIKQDIVNEFLVFLDHAGIDADILQFSPVALYNYIQYDHPVDETTAVLDLGANNCDLLVIEGQRYWIRNVPLAARDFTEAIQDELQISFNEAEKLKRQAGRSSKGKQVYEILQPVYRDLVQEIHRSIGFYKSMSEGSTIDQIFMVGGGANTVKLEQFISENMQVSTRKINDLNRVDLSSLPGDSQLPDQITTAGPAIGLALQGMGATANKINLLPDRIIKEKQIRQKRPYVIAALVMLIAASALYYLSLSRLESEEKKKQGQLEEISEQIDSEKKRVKKAKNQFNARSPKEVLEQSQIPVPDRKFVIQFWRELLKVIPDNQNIRNRLNEHLVGYFRELDKKDTDLPETYREFRKSKNLPDAMKDLQSQARQIENEFLWLLDVDFNYKRFDGKASRGSIDVYCAVVKRSARSEEYSYVLKSIYEPLKNRLSSLQDEGEVDESAAEDLGPNAVQTVSSLDSFLKRRKKQESRGGGFGGEDGEGREKLFRVYKVHFEAKIKQ